ncbi:glycerophosphodiester phosphodiesterase [Sediminivirga luteola]|uniref:GP-PDE domain-containing protein n=1 Tax=Sediminivirga luteola TaxID=1774748 RepID=A0A8J2XEZ9_9MICO|nr:glycerophosphodiester phosphodiesterase [Sediminivirga luteola]MCI2265442.1 glycerophosphodiester phosphodiesterase [Sediminivirga luteola]GGA11148.1 hypothetical protein GCM10011333_12490 [Sediminivirga luteola]
MAAWSEFLRAHPDLSRRRPWVVAHRGYSGVAPENTLPAVDAALALGCEFVEVDLVVSGDGRPVVIHDPTIDRTTRSTGFVSALKAADLHAADAASWLWAGSFPGRFPEAQGHIGVPSLEAVLSSLAGGGRLLLEFKDFWSPAQIEQVAEAIREAGLMRRVVAQSFNLDTLEALHRVVPELPRCLLRHLPRREDMTHIEHYDVIACNPSIRGYSARQETVQEFLSAGLGVLVWTSDRPTEWARLAEGEVSGIITNQPGRLQGFLAARDLGRPGTVNEEGE